MVRPYPRSVWSVAATAVVAALVLFGIGAAAVIEPRARTLEGLATTTQFVLFPIIMLAGLLFSFHDRATDCGESAWVAAGLTAYGVPGIVLAGLRAVDSGLAVRTAGWVVAFHLPLAVVMLIVSRRADRMMLHVEPTVAGALAGLLVAAGCIGGYHLAPGLIVNELPALMLALEVGLFATCLALALSVRHLDLLPGWCTDRLALVAVALAVNHLAIAQRPEPAISVLAAVSGLVGAVAVLDVAAALLRSALAEQRDVTLDLADRVALMEADDRDSQARLHELTNSIAGIAVASTLINGDGSLSPGQRRRLEQMLESESHRLARLLGGDRLADAVEAAISPPELPILDVDEVIRPIVTSHRALRRRVRWQPSGELARGDADAMAEVINILVDNAARHAPDSEIVIEVTRRAHSLDVAVRDHGPGLPAEVRRRLFEWGERGPASDGKGIGLFLAHQLVTTNGHTLRLDMNVSGTTFVVELPLLSEDPR